MRKKFTHSSPSFRPGNQNTSFSALLDILDPEREAQRQEYLTRQKKNLPKAPPRKGKKSLPEFPPRKPQKGLGFEEKLERTNQWLAQTFPALFASCEPCKALDAHIVRDIKAHYRNEQAKRNYPGDLVIKAALYRYMESPQYLACLVKGAPRYNIKGEIVGSV